MGKGTILQDKGEGLYSVSLDYGSADINARIARHQARIAELDAELADLNNELLNEQASVRQFWDALDAAIVAYKADPSSENLAALTEASTTALRENSRTIRVEREIAADTLERSNLFSKIAILQAEVVTEVRDVWCTTYSTDLAGEVGTIEINGEGPAVNIVPGQNGATYSPLIDGDFRDRLAMSGAAAYLNAAILPGWQKYSPTYRSGLLVSIDRANNLGTVDLDPASSSAQELPINQVTQLTAEFVYLTCNHLAFDVGDEVVVQFFGQTWDEPRIIGFVSNPKQCGPERIIIPLMIGADMIQTEIMPPSFGQFEQYTFTQFTPYTSGRVGIPMNFTQGGQQDPFPGYVAGGQVNNASNRLFTVIPHISDFGIMQSEDTYGDDFTFSEQYRLDGANFTMRSVTPPGYVSSALQTPADIGPFIALNFVSIQNTVAQNGNSFITDFLYHRKEFNIGQQDLEEQQEQVTGLTADFLEHWEGVPELISIRDVENNQLIEYRLHRFYRTIAAPAGYSDFPDSAQMFAQMGIGYKRERPE